MTTILMSQLHERGSDIWIFFGEIVKENIKKKLNLEAIYLIGSLKSSVVDIYQYNHFE